MEVKKLDTTVEYDHFHFFQCERLALNTRGSISRLVITYENSRQRFDRQCVNLHLTTEHEQSFDRDTRAFNSFGSGRNACSIN